ncbi:RNA helicase [Christiangramia sp. OXR-203]|uniref:RNA helicase n=1 Tax=Christiangramia sp. OXR-203 TaxID=3100176 RepID=UPI002AC9C6A4|nr:RNA helicase [Christiangramia sp. OXR-203]WPY97613.1 RNA helicase [Christiangramia sp. OXR-203]
MEETPKSENHKKMKCGIIMPIASHSDYPTDHWTDVLDILIEAIEETDFEPRLVSDDVAVGLIHDRIVTNIYNDEIIVCDVSSKNPNVMFELGLRLAFDKPTIIIKDELTGYSFDTGVIEHINYPSSLRFNEIVKFKIELKKRINATYKKSQEESDYSPFLKSFGKKIVPASIQQTEIPEGKFILEQINLMRNDLRSLKNKDSAVKSFNNNTKNERMVLEYYIKDQIAKGKIPNERDAITLRNALLHQGVDLEVDFIKDYLRNIDHFLPKKL